MRGVALAALLAAGPASGDEPILRQPLDCDLGSVCFIQHYVDADPGPGVSDHACGPLSNDGHKGTDFALPSRAMMEAGVAVEAASPGVVRTLRDGMADVPADDPDAPAIEGRECGNGVVVAHDDGWETQYCHLKRGSVRVEPDQRVAAGTVIGEVGMSGNTTFPHLHLSVRKDGRVVDPFDPDASARCGSGAARTLWRAPPAYAPGGLIAAGFADHVPSYEAVKDGGAGRAELPDSAPALVLWGYVFGAQAGDMLSFAVDGPEGQLLAEDVAIEAGQPQLYRALGLRAPPEGWLAGRYTGTVIMLRGDERIDAQDTTVVLESGS